MQLLDARTAGDGLMSVRNCARVATRSAVLAIGDAWLMCSSRRGERDRATAMHRMQRFATRTIPEQVANQLGLAIVNGQLKSGHRLIESDLATKFGISRGPIREAIRILQRRRLVDLQPRRGAYVRAISLKSIADLFNARMALSMLAVRSFAMEPIESYIATLSRRVTEMQALVHSGDPIIFAGVTTRAVKTIARGSGNDLVVELLTDLADQTLWTTIWNPRSIIRLERYAGVCRPYVEGSRRCHRW